MIDMVFFVGHNAEFLNGNPNVEFQLTKVLIIL